jgi:transposase-like protein
LVEIDDAFFGGRSKGKSGRGAHGKLNVVVIVERLNRRAGDAALLVLPDQSGAAFLKAVKSVVEPMTHIRTDAYPTNSILHALAGKLNMDKIGKIYSEHGPLENVDRVISLAKRYLLGTYHQYCSRAHLQRFLNEFAFRFNRRYHWSQLFSRTLAAAALNPPVRYAALS